MSYSEKDFKGCAFNPLVKGKMLNEYSRLCEIISPEWDTPYLDELIRYVICVYDPKSPLAIQERDLNYRKGVAAELAKMDMDNNDFIQAVYNCSYIMKNVSVEDALLGGDFPLISDLIMKYLMRFVKSKEWAAIIIVENCFWESAKKLMEPISGKNSKEELEAVQKKSAIKDELDKDIARLEKYFKSFFGDDDDLALRAKTRVTPESIAKLK